jgi:hypothetical protein
MHETKKLSQYTWTSFSLFLLAFDISYITLHPLKSDCAAVLKPQCTEFLKLTFLKHRVIKYMCILIRMPDAKNVFGAIKMSGGQRLEFVFGPPEGRPSKKHPTQRQ